MIIMDDAKTDAILMARLAEKAETNRLKKQLEEEKRKVCLAKETANKAIREFFEAVAVWTVFCCLGICALLAGYEQPIWTFVFPILVAWLAMKKVGWV